MNARIVNLRTARKQKARAEKQDKAAQRIREAGSGGAERAVERQNEATRIEKLDQHRKDDDS